MDERETSKHETPDEAQTEEDEELPEEQPEGESEETEEEAEAEAIEEAAGDEQGTPGMTVGRFAGYICGIAGLVLGFMTVSQMVIDRGPQDVAFAMFVAALALVFAAALLLWRHPAAEADVSPLPPPEGKPFLDDLVCSKCGADVSNAPECPECGHRGRMTKTRYKRTFGAADS
jgi:hypothetical protein